MPQLKLSLFGPPRVALNDQPTEITLRKGLAILSYLAATGQPHSRDSLATLFWPESSQRDGRASLRRTLYRLNQVLDSGIFQVTSETVSLSPDADLWLDTQVFQQYLAQGPAQNQAPDTITSEQLQHLTDAASHYTDDFMAGFTLAESPEFDEWQFFQREELRQQLVQVLSQLTFAYQHRAEFEQAISYARRWLALDSLEEPTHRHLMRLYALAGQPGAAVRQYQECVRILDEELGVPPEEETTALYEDIRAKRISAQPRSDSAPSSITKPKSNAIEPPPPEPARHNLPAQSTPFVGREEELAQIKQLLQVEPDCRLLTLIGPGGIGKTRLALEAASGMPATFAQGVYLVSLVSIQANDAIIPTIAQALGFKLSSDPLNELLDYLRQKSLLLILDNSEHLLTTQGQDYELADLVSHILATAPQVKLLITSRERLNLQGEWIMEISGLTAPEIPVDPATSQALTTNGGLESYSAVQLFLQSARRAFTGFALLPENGADVVRICRLVQGMPLGIELAAAWVRTLSCAEIAQEIERNLDFLETSHRNVPSRHRSLRAAFEHSWQFLTSAEQAVLRKLSVFQNGFSRQAAQTVSGASLLHLSALIDKSLLRQTDPDYYEMHRLLAQYAAEKLAETAHEQAEVKTRHFRYYAEFMKARAAGLKGGKQQITLAEIGRVAEDVRLAWDWALTNAQDSPEMLDHLNDVLSAFARFYDMNNRYQEGEDAFSKAAVRLSTHSHPSSDGHAGVVLGKILARQGWFAFHLGRLEESQTLLKQSLTHLRSAKAEQGCIYSLNYLGAVTRHLGGYDEATTYLQESLALCQKYDDRYNQSIALNILGQIAYLQGDYAEARWLCQESLLIKRELGDQWGLIFSLTYQGAVANATGELDEARQLFEESLSISQAIGDRRSLATGLNSLGDTLVALGDYTEAETRYRQSLTIFEEIGNQLGMITAHTNLGRLAGKGGNLHPAWSQFRTALKLAIAKQVMPHMMDIFLGAAELWHADGDHYRAANALALILKHPAARRETQDQATELLATLGDTYTKIDSSAQSINTIVKAILEHDDAR